MLEKRKTTTEAEIRPLNLTKTCAICTMVALRNRRQLLLPIAVIKIRRKSCGNTIKVVGNNVDPQIKIHKSRKTINMGASDKCITFRLCCS